MVKRAKKLVVCYDPGTSLSKILYRVGKGKVKHLAMESELFKVSDSKSLPTSSGFGKPEHNAWVQLAGNNNCYVVGRLALEYRASASIKKLKSSLLIPKILAAVGAIATREKLSNEFDLRLAILLPFGESSNLKQLEEELSEAVQSFSFQGQEYQVNLTEYACYPEAYGIFSNHASSLGVEQIQKQNLAYLMFGYRNTSLLLFREGTLSGSASCTTQLGFYDLIDRVVAKTSGISREEVQATIRTYTESFPNPKTYCRDTREVTGQTHLIPRNQRPSGTEKHLASSKILALPKNFDGDRFNWHVICFAYILVNILVNN